MTGMSAARIIIDFISTVISFISRIFLFLIGKKYGAMQERLKHYEKAAQSSIDKTKEDYHIDSSSDDERKRLRKKWNPRK